MNKMEYKSDAELMSTVLGVKEEAVLLYSIEDVMENPYVVGEAGHKIKDKVYAMNELARRMYERKLENTSPSIRKPEDCFNAVYNYMKSCQYDMLKEHFMIVCLNIKNRVLAVKEVSCGSMTASVVHPREVFKTAIKNTSGAIILAHNHPSGDVTPSENDIEITKQLVKCGKIMDIPVLDHIVLSDYGKYFSMKEEGVLF